MEYSKKSNKITDIVKLQLLLKKWRKNASTSSKNTATTRVSCSSSNNNNGSTNKSMKFLKRTLSLSNTSGYMHAGVSAESLPKGYLAVCVGEELKRYKIPTMYLGHPAFGILLREAEEEFGFHQEGILRIPCDVYVFEAILKSIERKDDDGLWFNEGSTGFCSSESSMLSQEHYHSHSPMCR